jgi:hypothetical protein
VKGDYMLLVPKTKERKRKEGEKKKLFPEK